MCLSNCPILPVVTILGLVRKELFCVAPEIRGLRQLRFYSRSKRGEIVLHTSAPFDIGRVVRSTRLGCVAPCPALVVPLAPQEGPPRVRVRFGRRGLRAVPRPIRREGVGHVPGPPEYCRPSIGVWRPSTTKVARAMLSRPIMAHSLTHPLVERVLKPREARMVDPPVVDPPVGGRASPPGYGATV